MADVGVFPAHAGMIPVGELHPGNLDSVPRACGDDPTVVGVKTKSTIGGPRACGDDPCLGQSGMS